MEFLDIQLALHTAKLALRKLPESATRIRMHVHESLNADLSKAEKLSHGRAARRIVESVSMKEYAAEAKTAVSAIKIPLPVAVSDATEPTKRKKGAAAVPQVDSDSALNSNTNSNSNSNSNNTSKFNVNASVIANKTNTKSNTTTTTNNVAVVNAIVAAVNTAAVSKPKLSKAAAAATTPANSTIGNAKASSTSPNSSTNAASSSTANSSSAVTNVKALAVAVPPSSSKLSTVEFAKLAECGVSEPTLTAVTKDMGYTFMFTAQAESIPIAMQGKDMFVEAKTGNGKTLAFLIPAIERLRMSEKGFDKKFGVVIMSNTQVLARQTLEAAQILLKHHKTATCYGAIGGTNVKENFKVLSLQGTDVLVATPDRLKKMLEFPDIRKRFAEGVRVFVLDEADEMLDGSFLGDMKRLAAIMPKEHQTLCFSATREGKTGKIPIEAFLKPDAVQINASGPVDPTKGKANPDIDYEYLALGPEKLFLALFRILRTESAKPGHKVVVFCSNNVLIEFLAAFYTRAGLQGISEAHGNLAPAKKIKNINAFMAAKQGIIFASDTIARGFDTYVSLSLQFGVSSDLSVYQHRSGRSGRRGERGNALMLLGTDELAKTDIIARLNKFFEPVQKLNTYKDPITLSTETSKMCGDLVRSLAVDNSNNVSSKALVKQQDEGFDKVVKILATGNDPKFLAEAKKAFQKMHSAYRSNQLFGWRTKGQGAIDDALFLEKCFKDRFAAIGLTEFPKVEYVQKGKQRR